MTIKNLVNTNALKTAMDLLWKWEFQIDGQTFTKEYIKNIPINDPRPKFDLANHIWTKFHGYNHSVLQLYANLDDTCQKALIQTILNTSKPILKLYER